MERRSHMKNTTRIKYKDIGTCLWCPRPRYEFNGHVYALCEKHRSDSQSPQRKRIDRPKRGLCVRCTKPAEYDRTLCEYHLDYERNRLTNHTML